MTRFLDYVLPVVFLLLMAYSVGQQHRIATTLDRIDINVEAARVALQHH
jgi:hypothetical protein